MIVAEAFSMATKKPTETKMIDLDISFLRWTSITIFNAEGAN